MGKVVVIQQVRTTWTKVSRGGESAGKRNAVPETARVPTQRIVADSLVLVHHRLSYSEGNGFAQPTEEVCVNPAPRPLVIGCVTIDHNAENALTTFRYNQDCGGAPDRSWAQRTLRLAVNEWGQMVYNGRFSQYRTPSYESYWWYEKRVVNVGLFEQLTPDAFTGQEPTYHFSAMADLF